MDAYRIKKYCLNPASIVMAGDIKLLNTSDLFLNEVISMIEQTKKSLLIEFYEIADDEFGIKLKNLLKKKAAEGVDIKIIYDSIGSRNTSGSYFSDMKNHGIKVIEYNPIRMFTSIRKWFRRDHRKIIVSDFSYAILGGFNLSLDYLPYSISGRNWKDFGVRFSGDVIYSISQIFRDNWISIGGSPFDIELVNIKGEIPVSLVWEHGIKNIHSIRRSYKYAMDNAKDFIYITNAYFLPDGLIYRCLKRAVIRGVDVKIILPFKTDHPYVRIASMSILKLLLKHGVKIYEWQGEVLHANTSVVDGAWVSIGSHNFDHISMHYNLEMNINIFDENIGGAMKQLFEEDLNNSKELTLPYINDLPVSTKIFSQFIYLFRNLI
jgi:cardiolipin synthase